MYLINEHCFKLPSSLLILTGCRVSRTPSYSNLVFPLIVTCYQYHIVLNKTWNQIQELHHIAIQHEPEPSLFTCLQRGTLSTWLEITWNFTSQPLRIHTCKNLNDSHSFLVDVLSQHYYSLPLHDTNPIYSWQTKSGFLVPFTSTIGFAFNVPITKDNNYLAKWENKLRSIQNSLPFM